MKQEQEQVLRHLRAFAEQPDPSPGYSTGFQTAAKHAIPIIDSLQADLARAEAREDALEEALYDMLDLHAIARECGTTPSTQALEEMALSALDPTPPTAEDTQDEG